jgi:RimJ/RimL family protein N-acetyltransferase
MTTRNALSEHCFDSKLLAIRPIRTEDENLYIDLFINEKVTTYTGGVLSYAQAKKAFHNSVNALTKLPIEYLTFVVTSKSSQTSIGILTLVWHNKQSDFAEFGVMFTLNNHNKGYCFELLNVFIARCFDQYKLTTLYSFTLAGNLPAQHILKKASFIKSASIPYKAIDLDGDYWALNKNVFKSN